MTNSNPNLRNNEACMLVLHSQTMQEQIRHGWSHLGINGALGDDVIKTLNGSFL